MSASVSKFSSLFRRFYLPAVLLSLLLGIVGVSFIDQWRIDLTEGRLYTLSSGTRNILNNIHEPVTLKFYYSETLMRDIPVLRNYSKRVEEMLREYERAANGKIVLEVIHPEVYSEEEDAAAADGLQGMPNGQGEMMYLGLAGLHGARTESIALFNPQKESLLEYQISQMVYRLTRPQPLVVGVLSGLPIFRSLDPKTNRARPAWLIVEQMKQLFDIRRQIDLSVDSIDADLNLLIVIHPQQLPEKTLFAIDQFVLRGGKLLVFVDPLAEADDSETGLLGEGFADRSSNLEQLFATWGIAYDPDKVVFDLGYAHSIPEEPGGREIPHVGILGLEGSAINREQNVVSELENINVASVGALSAIGGATTAFIPLLVSSDKTGLMDADQYSAIGKHSELLAKMKVEDKRYTFAAMVSGSVKSAFPAGKPATSNFSGPVMTESKEPIHAIVVADTDILTDRMWVQRDNYYGQVMASPFAANGDMLVNMVDALGGSADLMSLRSRGTYQRPFTRVTDLEKAASARLREQEDALTQALSQAERKISELNANAQDDSQGGEISLDRALSSVQKSEIAKFQQEKLKIRKNLREVRRQLNSDVERLGFVLRVINIAAIPVLLTVVAFFLSLRRKFRMRQNYPVVKHLI